MRLFRVFAWTRPAAGRRQGGPLYVARELQGAGRHDAPERYAAWYCAREAVSAVAEAIQFARGQSLDDADFVRAGGRVLALVELRLADSARLVDLDDPAALVERSTRPSEVATGRRAVTQRIAAGLFDEGIAGFSWWSTLEAAWSNVTLFHERALPLVSVAARPVPLSVELADVREAAERLGVRIR